MGDEGVGFGTVGLGASELGLMGIIDAAEDPENDEEKEGLVCFRIGSCMTPPSSRTHWDIIKLISPSGETPVSIATFCTSSR